MLVAALQFLAKFKGQSATVHTFIINISHAHQNKSTFYMQIYRAFINGILNRTITLSNCDVIKAMFGEIVDAFMQMITTTAICTNSITEQTM